MKLHLFLILQTNLIVLARKRGVRQSRQMFNSDHNKLELDTSIFSRGKSDESGSTGDGSKITVADEKGANGDEPISNIAYRKAGRWRIKKAIGSRRSTRRGASRRRLSPSMPTMLDVQIPPTNLPNLCLVNTEGTFGSEQGDAYGIGYFYQVEVEAGTTLQQLENDILPIIERATVNFMIPHMFETFCGSHRRLQLGLVQPQQSYLGISTALVDSVLEEVGCGRVFLQPCYVISGFITTHSKGKSLEEVNDEIAPLLDDALALGNLVNFVPGLDGVVFREMGPGPSTEMPTSLQSLNIEIPEPSPLFLTTTAPMVLSPVLTPTSSSLAPATSPPTPLNPIITTIPPTGANPTIQPTLESSTPESVTIQPTPVLVQQETTENKSSSGDDDDTVLGLSAWWRWLLGCIILVIMLIAIFFVWYRGCSGKSKKQHESFEEEDGSNEL